MQKKVHSSKNVFDQDVFFIVEHNSEDNTYDIAGVGNLVLHYPSDCEVPAYKVTSQRIVALNQYGIGLLAYHSDGSYDRTGAVERYVTPELLQELILQGYHTKRVNKIGKNNIYLTLENKDYDMLIFLKDNRFYSKKMWRDGIGRAHDIDCLNTNVELDAVLAVLANHF